MLLGISFKVNFVKKVKYLDLWFVFVCVFGKFCVVVVVYLYCLM